MYEQFIYISIDYYDSRNKMQISTVVCGWNGGFIMYYFLKRLQLMIIFIIDDSAAYFL